MLPHNQPFRLCPPRSQVLLYGSVLPGYPEQVPYDECLDIVAEDAYETGRRLVKSDGVFLGQSAAAALKAATIIAERPEAAGKNIAIIMADNAFKYLSTRMYAGE